MKLSVIIPAHDEADSIRDTVEAVAACLSAEKIDHEILIIDDASEDGTAAIAQSIAARNPRVRCVRSRLPPGYGHAVRAGLELFTGDAVVIVMADLSDSPQDIVTTNAFKAYRRHVIEGLQPLLSNHFNLTVEMPLKAVVRGYTYAIVPVTWTNRRYGVSKLKLQEMGSRYVFIALYVWLEHHLSRGDYRRPDQPPPPPVTSKRRRHAVSSPASRRSGP